MKYLLDTHTLLWYFDDSYKLPNAIATEIENMDAQKFISVASLWEFTIKHNSGKLSFDGGISTLCKMLNANRFTVLNITEPYLIKLGAIPLLHRDPFDRLIIATAIVDDITILTADENIHKYDVRWMW